MEETDERQEGGAAGGAGSAGEEQAAELRAEEESAKAMEAEVPHPPGYDNPGQEQPS
ncbi:MAG: hypothetical protein JOZ96_25050 [Acidobacteria bacterium]|nr:hypothetical protein [Acidobacteriota bacterium]